MIIFHEGLPRSGKSYEAIIKMIEWLKEGRKIVTNIAGIDREKVAALVGVPVPFLDYHLRVITNEQVQEIWKHVPLPDHETGEGGEKDLRIIIDELQDFFPAERQRPPKELSTWVASHGHAGWHILALGQDLRDCHNIWKRRVQRKLVFTKQTALGRQNSYRWEAYEATKPERFRVVGVGVKDYDKQYFGAYQSHVDGTTDTGAVMDDRAIIWKRPAFRFGIPAALAVAALALYHLFGFFSGPDKPAPAPKVATKPAPQIRTTQPASLKSQPRPQPQQKPAPPPPPPPLDYVDKMANQYRLRLSGLIQSKDKVMAKVEVMDSTFHLKESFSIQDLESMGWNVDVRDYGLVIAKQDKSRTVEHVVRPWPIDPFGRASERTRKNKAVRGDGISL